MGLRILRNADGSFRATWYGRISIKGMKRETNLNVPIAGTVPTDADGNIRLSDSGDDAFERSRKAAQKAFDKWREETKSDPAELQRKAHKARTGEDLEGLPLAKLFENWANVSRAKEPTADWRDMVKGWFADFAAFARAEARKHGKRCETANDITPEIAAAWFTDVKSKDPWETVLKKKHLISGAFSRLQGLGLARINPFANIQLRGGGAGDGAKVSRKALTAAETERLFEIARDDENLYPLIVTAACTGMRLGDVCNLKWADVDLKAGLIVCTTAKTGVRVTIPIFGRLREVLEDREPIPGDGSAISPFVFPETAADYNRTNENGNHTTRNKIIQAVKPYFARAVFGDAVEATDVQADGETVRPLAEVIDAAGFTETKRARLLEVDAMHKAGKTNIEIARKIGKARSVVFGDLREIEKLTGARRERPIAEAHERRKTRFDLIEQTRQDRKIGNRAACVFGWHSFRHAFVVLALQAGVPVEDVRRIVGHGDAETTLKNYNNPEEKHAAERMREKMAGTVLDGGKRIGKAATAEIGMSGGGAVAVAAVASVGKVEAAARSLALARAVMPSDQARTVAAVLAAAGVDADAEPERALALIAATVDAETKARIAAVIQAAGV